MNLLHAAPPHPDFSLILSFERITVTQRGTDSWMPLGEAPVDDNVTAALTALVEQSGRPAPYRALLLLPPEQIRFMTVPGHLDRDAVLGALDGATPYAVADLVVDFEHVDGHTRIAAVAAETLTEVEDFARNAGFEPVAFTGVPGDGGFAKGADFGAPPGVDPAPAEPLPAFTTSRDIPPRHSEETIRPLAATGRIASLAPAGDPPDPAPSEEKSAATTARDDPSPLAAVESLMHRPAPTDKTPPAAPPKSAPKPAQKPAPAQKAEPSPKIGARPEPQPRKSGGLRYAGMALAALAVVGLGAWAALDTDPEPAPEAALQTTEADATPLQSDTPAAETEAEVETASSDAVEPEAPAAQDMPLATAPLIESEEAGAFSPDAIDPQVALLPDPATEQAPPSIPTPAEGALLYDHTGILQAAPTPPAPPPGETLDALYSPSIDAPSPANDAVALPSTDTFATDLPPGTLASPAPAGTAFDLGPDGRVQPTVEGALTPEGVTVYLGPPPIVPPETPDRSDQSRLQEATDEAVRTAALSGRVPLPRPDGLVEANERTRFGGRSVSELSSIPPLVRPEGTKAAAEIDTTPTAQAVAVSRLPRNRPADLAAQAQAKAPAAPAPAAAAVAAPAPAPAAVSPRIPSAASVARAATTTNVINMRDVNLIGIFGSASNRRALIRLSNGRLQKVTVGDELDGGRVAAIGDGEVRYVKRGRNHVLRMPSG
ncbi:hypothetical protein SAMN05421688_2020 [Poseidonocella pacifica]|uniref:Type IV pilus biogenesis protein PilP n=1 Tax=Poseidonocella pacifica TaxID=871651 RepID=A0A1I0XBB2_9RHOB|nr:hypothetical protein [Poseidonocella pacifica]SFA97630.1 hypothetical protein SAMN05421688_2020 [Poseidonocella pacifica]